MEETYFLLTLLVQFLRRLNGWYLAPRVQEKPPNTASTELLQNTGKKTNQEKGKNKDKEKEKESKSVEVKTNNDVKTCAYCNKAGHNILKYFKLINDQASAKADGNLDTKKEIAAPTITRQDEIEEENTGFSSFPAVARIPGTFSAFPIYFRAISDSTKAGLAFGGPAVSTKILFSWILAQISPSLKTMVFCQTLNPAHQ